MDSSHHDLFHEFDLILVHPMYFEKTEHKLVPYYRCENHPAHALDDRLCSQGEQSCHYTFHFFNNCPYIVIGKMAVRDLVSNPTSFTDLDVSLLNLSIAV